MLPIALTCPVWWVARWAARMVASLAVVVAFSLGATTLPVGAAAQATPRSLGVTAPRLGDHAVAESALRPVVSRSTRVAGAAASAAAHTGGSSTAAAPTAGTERSAAGSTEPAPMAAAPTGTDPAIAGQVAPADRHRVLAGRVLAATGSRAPPAR